MPVSSTAHWCRSSLGQTLQHLPGPLLHDGPVAKPSDWLTWMDGVETEAELAALRRSVAPVSIGAAWPLASPVAESRFARFNRCGIPTVEPRLTRFNRCGIPTPESRFTRLNRCGIPTPESRFARFNRCGIPTVEPRLTRFNRCGIPTPEPRFARINRCGIPTPESRFARFNRYTALLWHPTRPFRPSCGPSCPG
jgi:hypothetical protein